MDAAFISRAVAKATLQAGFGGLWIAAAELSPARRRLARLGAVAAAGAIFYAAFPKEDAEDAGEIVLTDRPFAVTDPPPAGDDDETPEGEGDAPVLDFDKRKAIAVAGLVGLSAASILGRRHLEKRWLARLGRNGHRHPTRSLAVRMAAVDFVAHLALQMAGPSRK